MKRRLQDSFYITTSDRCLGWATSVDHGMDILTEAFPLTDNEREAAKIIMKFAFKYLRTPDPEGESKSIYPSMDNGRLILLNGTNMNPAGILGTMSPMLFRGLSSRLATLYHDGKEIFFVRVSDEQALPPDPYIALLQADIDSYWNGGIPVLREHTSRRAVGDPVSSNLVVRCGDESVVIRDMSLTEVIRALQAMGLPSLTDRERAVADFICTVCQLLAHARLRIYMTAIWQHRTTDGIQVGNIPVTYGHKGAYEKTATICGDAISGLPGRVCQLIVDHTSVLIDRVAN